MDIGTTEGPDGPVGGAIAKPKCTNELASGVAVGVPSATVRRFSKVLEGLDVAPECAPPPTPPLSPLVPSETVAADVVSPPYVPNDIDSDPLPLFPFRPYGSSPPNDLGRRGELNLSASASFGYRSAAVDAASVAASASASAPSAQSSS